MELNNNTKIHSKRLLDRGIDEFIGICKGILFDGVVSFDEAANLLQWLSSNEDVAVVFPASEVVNVLLDINDAGELSSEHEAQLLTLLTQITGNPEVFLQGDNASTLLPLCNPAPDVFFKGAVFVLTGTMASGSRKDIMSLIESRGGTVVKKGVRKDTNFLIVGDVGSSAWMHSTHGRKIEAAIKLRDESGTGIGIISETHFSGFV